MYVTLIGIQGPHKDQRIVVRPQQSVTVGRTEMSDIVLSADPQVSSRHFCIENDGACALLKDLKSTNGTTVNGQFVQQAILQDGDMIGVGQTTFQARIQTTPPTAVGNIPPGRQASVASPPMAAPMPSPTPLSPIVTPIVAPSEGMLVQPSPSANQGQTFDLPERVGDSPIVIPPDQSFYFGSRDSSMESAPPVAAKAANGLGSPSSSASPIRGSGQIYSTENRKIVVDDRRRAGVVSPSSKTYQRTKFDNGVFSYRVACAADGAPEAASSEALRPSAMFDVWRRFGIPVLMTHFQKAGLPLPENLRQSIPVFDWLPPDLGRQYGPVIWQPEQVAGVEAVVDPLWGKDALLVILVGDPAAAAKHLVQLVHHKPYGETSESSLFGYCWPGVLEKLLPVCESSLVHMIFGDTIVAMAMEVPGRPAAWQLFSLAELKEVFDRLGLTEM